MGWQERWGGGGAGEAGPSWDAQVGHDGDGRHSEKKWGEWGGGEIDSFTTIGLNATAVNKIKHNNLFTKIISLLF